MRVLVVGSGGREHVLVWKILQSPKVSKVYCAPGNAGIRAEGATNVPIPVDDLYSLSEFALKKKVDLTVVGPEEPLINGIVDLFESRNLAVFGPRNRAAILEGSKVFAKEMMRDHHIPTADFEIFDDRLEAVGFIRRHFTHHAEPKVIKADGLAGGKGVKVCRTTKEATRFIDELLVDKVFGKSGNKIIIEDFIEGEEVSYIVFTDGSSILPLKASQDHKLIFDGDKGSNTGGMGAYSPVPLITDKIEERIRNLIVFPILGAMAKEVRDYRGILYAGLMIDRHGNPWVLEFNCRFGDPETQPVLAAMESDIVPILEACIKGKLSDCSKIRWADQSSVCVVMTAMGYPRSPRKWDEIHGLKEVAQMKDILVFHAGTTMIDGQLMTSGGRVLCVTGKGKTIRNAIEKTYKAVKKIHWEGVHYRTDIGYRALI